MSLYQVKEKEKEKVVPRRIYYASVIFILQHKSRITRYLSVHLYS